MITEIAISIKRPSCGYYVRWFYNGFHYWNFLSDQESLLTEGEKYNTLGKTKVRLYSGQLTTNEIGGLWPIMRAKDVSVYISGVWKTLLIDPGSLVTYRNQIAGYEFEVNATIGALQVPLIVPSPPVFYTTPPTFYSAEVGLIASNILVIRFDHLLQLITPSNYAFIPSFSGGAVSVTNVAITDVGGYYYVYLTLSRVIVFGETGTIQYDPTALGSELITGWNNNGFDTFTTSGKNITSAIDAGGPGHTGYTNNIALTINIPVKIIFDITLNSGVMPSLLVMDTTFTTPYATYILINGNNEFIFTPPLTQNYGILIFGSVNAQNFSALCSVKEMTNKLIGVAPYNAEVYSFTESVVNNVADLVPPVFDYAEIDINLWPDGDHLAIHFDRELDWSKIPPITNFGVNFSGGFASVTEVGMFYYSAHDLVVYLILDRQIAAGETGDVTYDNDFTPGDKLTGVNGALVPDFTNETVTNRT